MALPVATIAKLGTATIRGIIDRMNVETHGDFAIEGYELTELAVLAARMSERFDDPNELRDWQNRLNLLVEKCKSRKVGE